MNQVPTQGVSEEEVSPEQAFEAFCSERYGRIVSTVRLIVRDHAAAEDIAQEAFARAYLSWSKLYPDGNPAGWIHRVATNLALSNRRKAANEIRAMARLRKRTETSSPAPDAFPELHEAIEGLPARQRAAVALHYVLDLSVEDTAKAMKCKPGTVKSLLFSARERLRDDIGEDPR